MQVSIFPNIWVGLDQEVKDHAIQAYRQEIPVLPRMHLLRPVQARIIIQQAIQPALLSVF